jgi:hypothetical protein
VTQNRVGTEGIGTDAADAAATAGAPISRSPSHLGLPDWFWRSFGVFVEWIVPGVLLGVVGLMAVMAAIDGLLVVTGVLVSTVGVSWQLASAYFGRKIRKLEIHGNAREMVVDALVGELTAEQLERARATFMKDIDK